MIHQSQPGPHGKKRERERERLHGKERERDFTVRRERGGRHWKLTLTPEEHSHIYM